MQKVRKCIIPAAGFWTRFLPATKAQPKEMLPIVDKPVIQYLVEEAVEAGITDIMIVTGRGKQAIENHFDASFELEKNTGRKVKNKRAGTRRTGCQSCSNCLCEAAGSTRRWGRASQGSSLDRRWAMFGIIWWWPHPLRKVRCHAIARSIRKKQEAPIIALERVSDKRVSSYGIVESSQQEGKIYRVAKFLEKPKPEETTSRLGVIGKYIITPEVFDYLALDGGWTSKDGEIRLADAFARMVNMNKEVYGLEMEGDRYDTGDKFGFIKATVDYALAREDLGPQLLELLIDRVERYKK
jgi:UTP--glucose-1-phosphate uridylyltransferase